jgi:ABC-2 type transport system ATP-binding protein
MKTASKNHIIEVSHLIKRYKKAADNAVDDISFYVEEGDFFSLLGPNGAGKTTTISILTTILSRTSGKVTIAGYDTELSSALVRKNIGVIFQNPSLDLNLTAEENIRFHVNLYNLFPYRPGFSLMPDRYKQDVTALAKVVGLENDIFKPVKSLSGGMKRKLEIIRSLMHRPKILFLDEPTTGLDPISRQNLWKYLQEIRRKEKITIFLTTHYLEEAETSDYICVIDNGKIVAKGSPAEIKNALIENYLLVDTDQRRALIKELNQLRYQYKGNGPFKINIGKNSVQTLMKHIDTPLQTMEIHSPSLEDAYIEIITKHHEQS